MKLNRYFLPLLLLLGIGTISCQQEDALHVDDAIFGLGGNDRQTELDEWLHDNYVTPYNINVKYRWSTYEVSTTAQLVPVHRNLVKPMMQMIHDVWFAPYEKTAGVTFVKQTTPKNIVLVGSPEYDEQGNLTLGQAEGANKITLFDCNNFNPSNEEWLKRLLHTIEHEFAHILHQTRSYDSSFKSVCAGSYNPTGWYNVSELNALLDGFLSSYSMSGADEDFVEIVSLIMVYGPEWLDYRYLVLQTLVDLPAGDNETAEEAAMRRDLSARAAKGLERLQNKVQIVSSYMKTVWGIQFFDVEGGDKGLVGEVQEAIAQVLAQNAGIDYGQTDEQ